MTWSIAVSTKTGLVLGVVNFSGNPHDRDTLEPTLDHVRTVVGRVPKTAVVDRGYRGIRRVGATRVLVPNQDKPQTELEKRKLRRKCRRRAAIEPIIGHIKSDCRMQRNYLSGLVGDRMNALLAATGFNLRKRLRELAGHLRLLVFASVFSVVSFKGRAGIPKIQPILSS